MSGSRDVENCKVSTMREYEKKERKRQNQRGMHKNEHRNGRKINAKCFQKTRSLKSSTMNDNEQKWKKKTEKLESRVF